MNLALADEESFQASQISWMLSGRYRGHWRGLSFHEALVFVSRIWLGNPNFLKSGQINWLVLWVGGGGRERVEKLTLVDVALLPLIPIETRRGSLCTMPRKSSTFENWLSRRSHTCSLAKSNNPGKASSPLNTFLLSNNTSRFLNCLSSNLSKLQSCRSNALKSFGSRSVDD